MVFAPWCRKNPYFGLGAGLDGMLTCGSAKATGGPIPIGVVHAHQPQSRHGLVRLSVGLDIGRRTYPAGILQGTTCQRIITFLRSCIRTLRAVILCEGR